MVQNKGQMEPRSFFSEVELMGLGRSLHYLIWKCALSNVIGNANVKNNWTVKKIRNEWIDQWKIF